MLSVLAEMYMAVKNSSVCLEFAIGCLELQSSVQNWHLSFLELTIRCLEFAIGY